MVTEDYQKTILQLKQIREASDAALMTIRKYKPEEQVTDTQENISDTESKVEPNPLVTIEQYVKKHNMASSDWSSNSLSTKEANLIFDLMRKTYSKYDFIQPGFEHTVTWDVFKKQVIEAIVDHNDNNRDEQFWHRKVNSLFQEWRPTLQFIRKKIIPEMKEDYDEFLIRIKQHMFDLCDDNQPIQNISAKP